MPLTNEQRRKRYAEDPDYREKVCATAREQGRLRRARDAQKLECDPEFRETKRKDRADRERRWRYGLAKGDYERMLLRQHGVCAICEQKPRATLCVDHCHSTRQVRGLLAARATWGLGASMTIPAAAEGGRVPGGLAEDRKRVSSEPAREPPAKPALAVSLTASRPDGAGRRSSLVQDLGARRPRCRGESPTGGHAELSRCPLL